LFIALAVVCLIMQGPAVFLTAATAWLGAACARVVSLLIDRSFSPKNAAHALSVGATIVTNNEREFRRVPNLRVENWLS
jgi:tRNA(fMet)-specific endonuclease VapC